MRIFSVLVIFLLCIKNVRADTYYVLITGNNSYSGDQENPRETLQNSADYTDPEDTGISLAEWQSTTGQDSLGKK
ncbi:MAG: hypothetical protein JXB24_11860 [Bacteroidales bacterium]|nr:hypothetical protein [Bacteroidales bacterium]